MALTVDIYMSFAFAPTPILKPYYQKGDVTLYCSTYQKILPELDSRSIDALITDPPYGNTQLIWDRTIDWKFFWTQTERICKLTAPMVIFSCGKFTNQLINSNTSHYRYELIWEKPNVVGFLDANFRPLRNHENILIFARELRKTIYNPQFVEGKLHSRSKGLCGGKHYSNPKKVMPGVKTNLYHPRSVLKFDKRPSDKNLHPTQKPIDLMRWLVRAYSNPAATILEPFAGSGSTIVAAAIEGRKVVAIEQSEEYCEVIARRLESGE